MKLFITILAIVVLAGCATERQVSFGEIPIIRINHKMLQQKAGRLGVMGMAEGYSDGTFKIYYSAELSEMQVIANVIHEGIGHVHVWRTGDASIWDTIDMLAAKDVYGMIQFPVASDRHPSKAVFAWDKSEHAQEIRAIYTATVEARKSGGKY